MLTIYSFQIQLLSQAHTMWGSEKYQFVSDKVRFEIPSLQYVF